MFSKTNYYFASYEVKDNDLYLFAVGTPCGDDKVKIDIYVGRSMLAARYIIGGDMVCDNQEAFDERVEYRLEKSGKEILEDFMMQENS